MNLLDLMIKVLLYLMLFCSIVALFLLSWESHRAKNKDKEEKLKNKAKEDNKNEDNGLI